jgi:DnaK suppressor protein
MLSAEQLSDLAKRFDEEIALLTVQLEELVEFTKPIAPENSIGRISRMDAINNKSINDDALIKVKQRLKRLDRQRDKINDKSFGQCIKCGSDIVFGRLMYIPETTVCVDCAP